MSTNTATIVIDVEKALPHRPPFLLIDRIVECVPGEFARTERTVSGQDPVFAGHFPGYAVFPGVLVVENMAQTACCVLSTRSDAKPDDLYVLVRIMQCTFSGMVLPDQVLHTEAVLQRRMQAFFQFSCRCQVAGSSVATAELLVAIKERNDG